MRRLATAILTVVSFLLVSSMTTFAGPTGDEMNAANNPLQPTPGFNLQNYYTGSFYGLDGTDANTLLLRSVVPHKTFGRPQLVRATLPIVTSPDLPAADSDTALGDLNLFDIFLFKAGKAGKVELGVGPLLAIPTATLDETGTGKWQAGAAALLVSPRTRGIAGALVTWQASFAGDDARPAQNTLQVQPILNYNLSQGWYLRSSALWTWDLEQDTHAIPIGAGVGKVWKHGGVTWNAFLEPQWTVWHGGDGVPQFQTFVGLNMQSRARAAPAAPHRK